MRDVQSPEFRGNRTPTTSIAPRLFELWKPHTSSLMPDYASDMAMITTNMASHTPKTSTHIRHMIAHASQKVLLPSSDFMSCFTFIKLLLVIMRAYSPELH